MIIFWLTCLVGYPRTSATEPKKISKKVLNLHLSKAIEIVNAMNGEGEDKVE